MTMQTIPLPGSAKALHLDGPFPLTPEQWEHVQHVLEAMRPGLVTEADEDQAQPEPAGMERLGDPDE